MSLTFTTYHYSAKHSVILKCFLFITAVTIFNACSSNKNITASSSIIKSPPLGDRGFDKQGHRGCRGLMPENTIPAMLHALDLGGNHFGNGHCFYQRQCGYFIA